jgi:hypothetical protein
VAEGMELDRRHRATVERIFNHPVSHNIQWHDVLALLQHLDAVTEDRHDRYTVTLGAETETFDGHRGHDLGRQQVVDLRRMLRGAGIGGET